jgi:uncharacterized protein (TIGR03067 family)
MKFKLFSMMVAGLLVLSSGCKSAEERAKEDAAKKVELDKIKGKWKVVSREGDKDEEAEEIDESKKAGYFYIIDGESLREVYIDKTGTEEVITRQKLRISLDKDPKKVDMLYVDEAGAVMKSRTVKKSFTGKKRVATTELKNVAIYKVDGDNLTFNISFDDTKTPTDFTAPPGSSRYILKLERVKDGTEKKEEKKDEKTEKKDEKKDPAKAEK